MSQISRNRSTAASLAFDLVRVVAITTVTLALTSRVAWAQSIPPPPPLKILARLNPDNPLEVKLELKNAAANKAKVKLWRFGDRSRSTEASPAHTFKSASIFRVQVRYLDSRGTEREIDRKLNLASPPRVTIESFGQVAGQSTTALWFQAVAKSASTRIDASKCRWTFGDGASAVGARPQHTYAGPGTFAVDVSLEDSSGNLVTDGADVTVKVPAPTPPPLPPPVPPPPPPPPPPPKVVTLGIDFETTPEGIDGSVLKLSTDARQGRGALSMDLLSGAALYPKLWSFLLPKLLSFAFVDRVEAAWFSRWNGTVSFDVTKLKPALDSYLASHPTAFSSQETQKLRAFADAVIAAGPAFPRLSANEWHCLGATYEFPSSTSSGVLRLRSAGVTFLELRGFSVLDDDKILGALIDALVAGKAVTTAGTTSWLDDLTISNQAVTCP